MLHEQFCALVSMASSVRDKVAVCLRLGDWGVTCWNRLSNAASFSTCWRYSARVVAPMQRSSPRASMGLNRLAASIGPSVLPAPRMLWISSINRMMLPASFTSFRMAWTRSSNSPLQGGARSESGYFRLGLRCKVVRLSRGQTYYSPALGTHVWNTVNLNVYRQPQKDSRLSETWTCGANKSIVWRTRHTLFLNPRTEP